MSGGVELSEDTAGDNPAYQPDPKGQWGIRATSQRGPNERRPSLLRPTLYLASPTATYSSEYPTASTSMRNQNSSQEGVIQETEWPFFVAAQSIDRKTQHRGVQIYCSDIA